MPQFLRPVSKQLKASPKQVISVRLSAVLNTQCFFLGSREFTSQQSFCTLLTIRVKFHFFLSTELTTVAYHLDLGQEIAFPRCEDAIACENGRIHPK
jgi:hypothetical protein